MSRVYGDKYVMSLAQRQVNQQSWKGLKMDDCRLFKRPLSLLLKAKGLGRDDFSKITKARPVENRVQLIQTAAYRETISLNRFVDGPRRCAKMLVCPKRSNIAVGSDD